MPYKSIEEIKDKVNGADKLSDDKLRQFKAVFNKCWKEHEDEGKCHAMAWGAVKKSSRTIKAFCRNSPETEEHYRMYERLKAFVKKLGPSYVGTLDSHADVEFRYVSDNPSMWVRFYSDSYVYAISVHSKPDKPIEEWYLGAYVSTRYHRPTEDWVRGNDLPDGDFTESTWRSIVSAFAGYQLLDISEYADSARERERGEFRSLNASIGSIAQTLVNDPQIIETLERAFGVKWDGGRFRVLTSPAENDSNYDQDCIEHSDTSVTAHSCRDGV